MRLFVKVSQRYDGARIIGKRPSMIPRICCTDLHAASHATGLPLPHITTADQDLLLRA